MVCINSEHFDKAGEICKAVELNDYKLQFIANSVPLSPLRKHKFGLRDTRGLQEVAQMSTEMK